MQVVVSTKAFGMGIDQPDVELVVRIGCPPSLEDWVQEFGRAGRDAEGMCHSDIHHYIVSMYLIW